MKLLPWKECSSLRPFGILTLWVCVLQQLLFLFVRAFSLRSVQGLWSLLMLMSMLLFARELLT